MQRTMIRPRRVLVAPSICTLRFLRHITSVPIFEPNAARCLQRHNSVRRPCLIFSRRASATVIVRSEIQNDAEYNTNPTDWSSLQGSSEPMSLDWDQPFSPLVREAQALLKAGRIDDARTFWENIMYTPAHKIPNEEKEIVFHQIARDLMRALSRAGRYSEIPAVFHLLATRSPEKVPMDVNLLNKCLEAYSRAQRWERLLKVFQWHVKRTTPDEWTYELCMMALVGQGQYQSAWEMLVKLEGSLKPPTPKCLIIYMQGLRRAGTSLEEMVGIFEALEDMAEKRGAKPTEEVINFMLEEAMLAGKPDVGERFLNELTAHGYTPSADTYSAFLSAQAAARDWDSVASTMETMKLRGYHIPPAKMNILLRSFGREHDAEQTENFIQVMAKEGALLSTTTYNLLMQRYIDETKYKPALEVVKKMTEAGHLPNSMTVRIIFEMLRNKNIQHRPALARLMRDIYNAHPSLIPPKLHKSWSYNNVLQTVKPGHDNESLMKWDPVIQGMEAALKEEYPLQALSIFREHLPPANTPPPAALLDVVIKAFMQLPDPPSTPAAEDSESVATGPDVYIASQATDTTNTTHEPRDVRQIPFQIAYTIERYIHTLIDKSISSSQAPLSLILASYKFKDHYRLPISHDAAIHAASTYCSIANPLAAIHLMNDVSKTPWGRRIPWDLNALTVLLRAYAIMKDMRGAQWVVGRLIDGGFVPDRRVLTYLAFARRGGEKQMKTAVEKLQSWLRYHRMKVRGGLKRPLEQVVKGLMKAGIREGEGMVTWEDHRWMERKKEWAEDKRERVRSKARRDQESAVGERKDMGVSEGDLGESIWKDEEPWNNFEKVNESDGDVEEWGQPGRKTQLQTVAKNKDEAAMTSNDANRGSTTGSPPSKSRLSITKQFSAKRGQGWKARKLRDDGGNLRYPKGVR